MKTYKHYSFDLWMTLIRSHPDFKQERTKFFYQHYNGKEKTLQEVTTIFRQVDVMCNATNESTGNNIDAEEMYLMVISTMNDGDYSWREVNQPALYHEMEQLVFKYPPVFCSAETPGILSRLKQQAAGSTFSLLCNTAFIKGCTLRKVLDMTGLGPFFDFQLYSDETGMSKPNEKLFGLMIEAVREKRMEPSINLKDIVHIGDNPYADIDGAERAGISSMLVNSNHLTIANLLQ